MSRVKVKTKENTEAAEVFEDVDAALADIESNFEALDKDLSVADVDDILGDLEQLTGPPVEEDLADVLAELDNDIQPEAAKEKPRKKRASKKRKAKAKEEDPPIATVETPIKANFELFIDALAGVTDELKEAIKKEVSAAVKVVDGHEMASTKRGTSFTKGFADISKTLKKMEKGMGDIKELVLTNNKLLGLISERLPEGGTRSGRLSSDSPNLSNQKKEPDVPAEFKGRIKGIYDTLVKRDNTPEDASKIISQKLESSAYSLTAEQVLALCS